MAGIPLNSVKPTKGLTDPRAVTEKCQTCPFSVIDPLEWEDRKYFVSEGRGTPTKSWWVGTDSLSPACSARTGRPFSDALKKLEGGRLILGFTL